MLEQRRLLQFLTSANADLNASNGRSFFDMVQGFSEDELWRLLQTGMTANEQDEQRNEALRARRYGSAGLYVIPGGRR